MVLENDDSTATIEETSGNNYLFPELKLLNTIVMQSSLGQTTMRLVDNFLWTVEKCAEWSLPDQEIVAEKTKKASGKSELVRPLPWVFFLPSLVMLRMIRMTVNVGAFLTGYPKITPNKLVKYLQLCRTRINNVRNSPTREKLDKDERSSMNEARRALIKSIRLTLASLSCLDTSKPTPSPPPTKIHVSSVLDPDAATSTSEEKSVTESTDVVERQRNCSFSEPEEHSDVSLIEQIEQYAMESSDGDEDFDPANCSVSSNESKSSKDDDESNEDESNISDKELRVIHEDLNTPLHVLLDGTAANTAENTNEKFLIAEQTSNQRSLAGESLDKVEERLSRSIDSPTCFTPDRSSQEGDSIFYSPISSDSDTTKTPIAEQCVSRDFLKTNEYANGDIHLSASMISETSTTQPGEANNGAVLEKRNANSSKSHKGKRTSNRRKK